MFYTETDLGQFKEPQNQKSTAFCVLMCSLSDMCEVDNV